MGFYFIQMAFGMLIFLNSTAWSQVQLPDGTKITQEQIKTIAENLPKLQEDEIFYHWTNQTTGMRWISQSYVHEGEVQFYNKPSAELQLYGPGVYIADNPVSSKNFGEVPVAFKIQKGTPLYDEEVVSRVLGKNLDKASKSVLGEHIPFLRNVSDVKGWYLFNHPQNAKNATYGGLHSPEAKIYVNNPNNWSLLASSKFKELIQNGDQDASYLKKILDLSDYMDGIGFARAMKLNPGNPWNEFVPDKFDEYQNALEILPEKTKAYFENKEKLRNSFTSKLLPEVYSAISGQHFSKIEDMVRNEGIRAGGEDPGQTFLAAKEHVDELKKNPYLQVVSVDQGDGKHLVHYFYPDAFHYQHLKGKISDDLFNQLQNLNADHLMSNHGLRQELNKKMMVELLKDLEKDIGTKPLGQVLEELVSIHPFADFNGRSVRMIGKLNSYKFGEPLHFFMSDMDLLMPGTSDLDSGSKPENIFVRRGTGAHIELQRDLIEELLKAKSEKRMPDYLKTGAIEKYVKASLPLTYSVDINNPIHQEMIKKRQWTQLLESAQKNFWIDLEKRIMNVSTVDEALNDFLSINEYSKINNLNTVAQERVLKSLSARMTVESIYEGERAIELYLQVLKEVKDPSILSKIPTEDELLKILSDTVMPLDFKHDRRHIIFERVRVLPISNEKKLSFIYHHFVKGFLPNTYAANSAAKWILDMSNEMTKNPKSISSLLPSQQEELLKLVKEISDDYIARGKSVPAQSFMKLYTDLLPHADPAVLAKVSSLEAIKAELHSKAKTASLGSCTSEALKALLQQYQ